MKISIAIFCLFSSLTAFAAPEPRDTPVSEIPTKPIAPGTPRTNLTPLPSAIIREKITCVDLSVSRILGQTQEEPTTQITELSSIRETWKVDTVLWVRNTAEQTEKDVSGVSVQTSKYVSLRKTVTQSHGFMAIEFSNIESTITDSTGSTRVKKQSIENQYMVRGTEKALIKSYVDGVLTPDRYLLQSEMKLGDGRRITTSVEKTPYVVRNSNMNSEVLEVLRSESSCIIEPLSSQ